MDYFDTIKASARARLLDLMLNAIEAREIGGDFARSQRDHFIGAVEMYEVVFKETVYYDLTTATISPNIEYEAEDAE